MAEKLDFARAVTSRHMDKILKLFKPGGKITVLVRNGDDPEKDFLMTNDNLDEVGKAVERAKGRPDA